MDRLSELQAQVNGANSLRSKLSNFLVSDVEFALSVIEEYKMVANCLDDIQLRQRQELADQQKRVEELEKELKLYKSEVAFFNMHMNDEKGQIILKLKAKNTSLRLTIKDLRGALEKIEGNGFCECVDSTCRACVARQALTKSSEGGG